MTTNTALYDFLMNLSGLQLILIVLIIIAALSLLLGFVLTWDEIRKKKKHKTIVERWQYAKHN